ncbi:DUF4292 domain-containing protein [Nonlabens sp. SY33080]|uniref:DUF4292 domain-containing protein n=1 Tax=Nonlabens sp. SY33080 TaxID=2719911 RepID=UPI0014289328|nr:DUF4292 domain-containing protein [Nonlabens sp. SY33080]
MKLRYLLVPALLIIVACGTQKSSTTALATAKKAKVVRSHDNSELEFNTLKARLGVDYEDDKQSRNITMNLRMEKGEKIWMSASILGLTLAKVYITPDRVQFYEKINKRSFDGDFRLISDFLGEDLTFEQLEDVLLGQAVENLSNHEFTIQNNEYQFKTEDVITKLFRLRPSDFKLVEQSVLKAENNYLTINYPEYQEVDNRLLPRTVKIDAKRGKRFSQVVLTFKSVEFNKELSFPFELPDNYRKIEL